MENKMKTTLGAGRMPASSKKARPDRNLAIVLRREVLRIFRVVTDEEPEECNWLLVIICVARKVA